MIAFTPSAYQDLKSRDTSINGLLEFSLIISGDQE